MNRLERRARQVRIRETLNRENERYTETLQRIPREQWGHLYLPPGLMEVWRSRDYLVQVFETAHDGIVRLTICRSAIDFEAGRWADGIPWDVLQRLKRECGRGGYDAVEVFPADEDLVNVANMRHLWVLPDKLPFAWRAVGCGKGE